MRLLQHVAHTWLTRGSHAARGTSQAQASACRNQPVVEKLQVIFYLLWDLWSGSAIRLILSSYLHGGWLGEVALGWQDSLHRRCCALVAVLGCLCGAGRETDNGLGPSVAHAPMGSVTSQHHGHANACRH